MDGGYDAEEEEEGYVGGCAPEVDCSTTEPARDGDGDDVGDELEA